MLALTRKVGETIVIGDNVEVTVISVAGDQVKLGINAPRDVSIHRKEVFIQIQEENKKAATTVGGGPEAVKNLLAGTKTDK